MDHVIVIWITKSRTFDAYVSTNIIIFIVRMEELFLLLKAKFYKR